MHYNRVVLTGNLCKDPELHAGTKGNPYTRARLAVNRRYHDRDNVLQEKTVFVDVSFFGKQAEVFSRYLKKGDPVLCEGHLDQYEWQADDGSRRSKISVLGDGFRFLSKRREGGGTEVISLEN